MVCFLHMHNICVLWLVSASHMKISSLLATRKIIQGFIVQTLYWIFCGGLVSNFENKVGRGKRWTVEGPGGTEWIDPLSILLSFYLLLLLFYTLVFMLHTFYEHKNQYFNLVHHRRRGGRVCMMHGEFLHFSIEVKQHQ